METNSKKVLAALPDYNDYLELASEIQKISFERMLTENAIKSREAEVFKEVMTNPKYFVNGKTVPVSYFENAYKFGGLEGEIIPMREHLADMVSRLEQKRAVIEIYKQMHELYKALAYQEKSMS